MPDPLKRTHDALRRYALSLPGATLDHPWGETVFKVRKRIFLFLGGGEDGLALAVKLPQSSEAALAMGFTQPTPYGLGQHGWVSAKIPRGTRAPVDLLLAWTEESYRAIAGKKLVAVLDAAETAPAPTGAPRSGGKRVRRRPRS